MEKSESPELVQRPDTVASNGAADGSNGFVKFPSTWRPRVRVTSEYDSDSFMFFHRISCKLFDNLLKCKLSFQNDAKGEILEPELALISKHLSLHCDIEQNNALAKASVDVGAGIQLKAAHDLKAQEGEVAIVADNFSRGVKLELSSAVPFPGMFRRASVKFPHGEISIEEKEEGEEEETEKMYSVNGVFKSHVLDGLCTAHYKDENLSLRYSYKDEQMTFTPSISLPSNELSFAFKRRFGSSDKLSYWYNFDSNFWSTVYKHTVGKDYKVKAGYDSEVRLGWASLWVGDENGKARTAPRKMKAQFMLQVPQDDITSSAFMFRVKKRWDI